MNHIINFGLLYIIFIDSNNENNNLEFHPKIFLTEKLNEDEIFNVAAAAAAENVVDISTGLSIPTHYGRPNWPIEFKYISEQLSSNSPSSDKFRVGVFFCGPKPISTVLHATCSSATNQNISFFYNKENF